MKKFVAVLFALSAASLTAAFAQSNTTATGTFSGTVAPKCVVKSNIDQLTLAEYEPFNDSDGFTTELYSDAGSFTFRSNAPCTITTSPGQATVPSGSASDVSTACIIPTSETDHTTAQTGLATISVPASITANSGTNSGILLAGTYSFTCTVTVTF